MNFYLVIESHHSDGDLPKLVGSPSGQEASDKNLALTQDADSATITALQNEVIELRQNKSRAQKKVSSSESDSLTGRVDDYQSLIASLAPSDQAFVPTESPNQASIPTNQPNDSPSGLLESLSAGATSSIPISSQDCLIIPDDKPADRTNLSNILPRDTALASAAKFESFATPEINTTLSDTPPVPKSSFAISKDIGTQIAFAAPSVLGSPSSIDTVQVADTEHEPQTIARNTSPIDPSFARAKAPPETTIASTTTPHVPTVQRDPAFSSANSNATIAENQQQPESSYAKQPSADTTSLAFSSDRNIPTLKQQAIIADKSIASISPSIDAIASTPSEARPTEQSRSIANNQSNSESPGKLSRDQIASSSIGNSSAEFAPKSQEFSKTPQSHLAQDSGSSIARQPLIGLGSTDRPSLVASSNTSDYSQSDRGTVRDLAKESKDKETQLANVISYPKFGGAAPTEESSKPVIQQQKPQSFQSSLARDSAPEKVHPLSESFVSGRILSQPNLSQPNKESQADFKSGDSKTTTAKAADAKITDGKSADVKADAKPSDFKTTDARLPEGRAADPRSFDASHLATSPTAKVGEAHGLHPTVTQPGQALPTDKVILAAANPATAGKTDNQPTGKGDGSTKLDAAHTDASTPDKTGKKPDGVDDKKETTATAKGPGSTSDTGKIPGGKIFNDLLDFIDKADQGADIKPGGKANVPLGGSNILSPDDVLITGTAAVGQAGFPGTTEETSNDESDSDKLSHRRKKYIVQPGDTLDSIAKAELGDERFSSLILTINQANIPSKEENGKSIAIKLQLGQILWLPSDHELQVYADLYLLD